MPAENLCGKLLSFLPASRKSKVKEYCDNRVRFEVLFRGKEKKTRIYTEWGLTVHVVHRAAARSAPASPSVAAAGDAPELNPDAEAAANAICS